jgi:anti-anti-sigma factor
MLTFHYNNELKEIRLEFAGRMDTLAVTKITEIIDAEPMLNIRNPGDKIVFDLKAVDYMASSFIRICVNQAKLAGPGRFSIANCQPFVKKTFKISGLDELLNIT